ncbi:MAG: RNA methyltransferase, partial [Terracidiphilus sp.]
EVVLVSPRNPLNIGAAARAMANFGFTRLGVVRPYGPTWREARSAVGAPEVLLNAKSAEHLAEAVAEATLVAGTGTLAYRRPEQSVVSLPELGPLVARELRLGGRVALVFGPEKHGLTREDLAFCHLLVEIPTDARQPSMNLGQAVAVCLYELAVHGDAAEAKELASGAKPRSLSNGSDGRAEAYTLHGKSAHDTEIDKPAARSGDLELLAGVVEEAMVAAGYSPRGMLAANRHDLRLMLRRLALSTRDTRRVLGLFRRILWRLRRGTKSGAEGVCEILSTMESKF